MWLKGFVAFDGLRHQNCRHHLSLHDRKRWLNGFEYLVYTEFILVWLCRKLLAYRNTLESFPGTNQYWAMSVKFLAQGNNGLPLTWFEPMWLAILRLLVWCVNHSTTLPHKYLFEYLESMHLIAPAGEVVFIWTLPWN